MSTRLPAKIRRALADFTNAAASVETDAKHFRMYEARLIGAISAYVAVQVAVGRVVKAARLFKQDRICVEGERAEPSDCWSDALVAINDALDAYDAAIAKATGGGA